MKVVALVSGGKDSAFNLLHCTLLGHEIVALANLYPPASHPTDEMDSFMYQTVGHSAVEYFSECMGGIPMYRQPIKGKSLVTSLQYRPIIVGDEAQATGSLTPSISTTSMSNFSKPTPTSSTITDETEDLFTLLLKVIKHHPDVQGVAVGAILSTYQRVRVENVCQRLGLVSLAFLWQRSQAELLDEIIASGTDARVIKTAAYGLGKEHLGKSLSELKPTLIRLNNEFGLHLCGEGGEYETLVFDCPIFKRRLVASSYEVVEHSGNDNVYFLHFTGFSTVEKPGYDPKDIELWKDKVTIPPQIDSTYDEVLNQIRTDDDYYKPKGEFNSNVLQGEDPTKIGAGSILTPTNSTGAQKDNETGGATTTAATAEEALQDEEAISFYKPDKTMHIKPRIIVNKELQTVWISNITAPPMASDYPVERVTELVFDKARQLLESQGLTFKNIMFTHALLKDMTDFGGFNKVYSGFFPDPNPPARVCVENGSLVHNSRVQLTVVATMDLTRRQGLHVQSRSHWAPCNIGPYSQAVSSERDGLVYFAGQIPLIPATMKLLETHALELHSVLSLQHLNRVATAYESQDSASATTAVCPVYAGLIAYVTSAKAGDAVAHTWPGFLSVTSWAGLDEEIDKNVDYYGHRIDIPLFVVQLSGLPKGALVEWSGYGIDTKALKTAKEQYDEEDTDMEDEEEEEEEKQDEEMEEDEDEEEEEKEVKVEVAGSKLKKEVSQNIISKKSKSKESFFFKPRYSKHSFKGLFDYNVTRFGLQALVMFTSDRELQDRELQELYETVFSYDEDDEIKSSSSSKPQVQPKLVSGTLFYTSGMSRDSSEPVAPVNGALLDEIKVDCITALDRRTTNKPIGYMVRLALVG